MGQVVNLIMLAGKGMVWAMSGSGDGAGSYF